jgi:dolichol-phosphate mannosyltransferase
MLQHWRDGSQVVWGVRAAREGISRREIFFANLFYRLLNSFSNVKLPPTGADYSLLDRIVIDALLRSVGANPSLALEIARLGFKQIEIPYTKEERKHGVSKWNLRKKLNAFADAFVTSSYMPLRLMSYVGMLVSTIGFIYAILIVVLRLMNIVAVGGWAALMVAVLVFGGFQMIMLGIIGEYLWRTLEQSRKRPLYFIEDASQEIAKERIIVP